MKAVTTCVCVVMNLAEGMVSMPESKGPVRKYFSFELYLRADNLWIVLFVCRLQMAPNEPRQAQTVPNGPRGAPDTRSGCSLMNIDILYQYAYSISCKIRIELLLPIYMTKYYHEKLSALQRYYDIEHEYAPHVSTGRALLLFSQAGCVPQ